MNIKVDFRELALFKEKWTLSFEKENLVVGDIQIWKDNKMCLCFERKTLQDLASSIKSNRYREQKYRLVKSFSKQHICYIIEGVIPSHNKNYYGLSWKTYLGVFINLQFRDNIKILFSYNTTETVNIIHLIANKIKDDKFFSDQNNYISAQLEHTKKSLMTPLLCYQSQLSQIPGISSKISVAISDKYPTLVDLIKNFKKPEDLSTLEIHGKRKTRLGKKRSENIYNFLHGKLI